MKEKNYTAVPHGYLDECEMLSDAEFGWLMRALLRYSIDGTPIRAEGNARFFARRMMNQEDINRARYEAAATGREERARYAAAVRWGRAAEMPDGCPRMPADASTGKDRSGEDRTEQNNAE